MDELLAVVQEISEKLSEISFKLDAIVTGLEEVPAQITGDMGYNLTDIFKELSKINTNASGA